MMMWPHSSEQSRDTDLDMETYLQRKSTGSMTGPEDADKSAPTTGTTDRTEQSEGDIDSPDIASIGMLLYLHNVDSHFRMMAT